MLLAFGDYRLDIERRELRRGAERIELEPKVFDLLGISRPQPRTRRQQGRSARSRMGRADRLGIRADHPDQRGAPGLGRRRRSAASHPHLQPQGRPFRRRGHRNFGRGSAPARAPDPRLPADKPSLAVLPFQNMSGDPEQEYFADGMVEEITTALSRFPLAVRDRPQFELHLQGQGGRREAGGARAGRALRARRLGQEGRQPGAHHRPADRLGDRRASLGRPFRRRPRRHLRIAGPDRIARRRRHRAEAAPRRK